MKIGGSTVLLFLACIAALARSAPQSGPPQPSGPAQGYLVLQGGGPSVAEINKRFVHLAGGSDGHLVVIPTTLTDDRLTPDGMTRLKARIQDVFGVQGVTLLHTRDRRQADSEAFVRPLLAATGLWILGGDEEQLVMSYVGTRTQTEIRNLVLRGGVVGGTSAGAMIQASHIPVNPDYPELARTIIAQQGGGFALLAHATIAPHFTQRGYEAALRKTVASLPEVVGIGIDEATAVIVHGTGLEVLGEGHVALYDGKTHGTEDHVTLKAGERFDFAHAR
nr:cyanophycinase [uncultured bacterium]